MDFSLLLLLSLLGAVVWFWQDSLVARELAHSASVRACRQYGVQLLDDTVALDGLWLRRDETGQIRLERRYLFEFTESGTSRQRGVVVMLGRRTEVLAMDGGDLFIP